MADQLACREYRWRDGVARERDRKSAVDVTVIWLVEHVNCSGRKEPYWINGKVLCMFGKKCCAIYNYSPKFRAYLFIFVEI